MERAFSIDSSRDSVTATKEHFEYINNIRNFDLSFDSIERQYYEPASSFTEKGEESTVCLVPSVYVFAVWTQNTEIMAN